MTRSAGEVRGERLHTLSQLFVEILDTEISPYTVHLQLYCYNDLIGQALAKVLGPLAKPLDFLARALENRLMIIQGFLHSNHSARIALELKKSASAAAERLALTAHPSLDTKPIIRRVMRKLLRHARHLGAFPVLPML